MLERRNKGPVRMPLRRWARLGLALFFALAGVLHFAFTDSFAAIVPPLLPQPEVIVMVTGAVELLLSAALLAGRWLRTVGLLLALYCLAVLPANVMMAIEPDLSAGLAPAILWLRVALQFPLIALILWATHGEASGVRQPHQDAGFFHGRKR
ncbi:MAG: DoxX family membrane protein [Pseudomonadota bacterium]